MAYSDFDLRRVVEDFGLTQVHNLDLFAGVPPVEPSDELRKWLEEFAPVAFGLGSARGRGAAVIFPILAESKRRASGPVTVASTVRFDVDEERGLTGVFDYLMTRTQTVYIIRRPTFAAVETPWEFLTPGLGHCAANLVALRLYNQKDGAERSAVYGCATSGNVWRFLKLEADTLFIDKTEYHLSNLPAILGILVSIAGSAPPV